MASTTQAPSRRRGPSLMQRYAGVPWLIPSLIILMVVMIIPIFIGLYYSFTRYSVLGSPQWIGLENFQRLLEDGNFKRSLVNTLVYTVLSVPAQSILALVIADVLARRFRNRFGGFVRSVLFIPVISSFVVIAVVWRALLSTEGGAVNEVLSAFGITPVNFLGDSTLAMLTVALVTVWKNIGYFLVIYYAGIMAIPADQYEASSLDGAGRWAQLRYITIPALRPVTLLVVILGTIWSFQVFDLVYIMTGGGPGGATTTIVMSIYQSGFQNFEMGYASAMAVVLFIVILIISVFQKKALSDD